MRVETVGTSKAFGALMTKFTRCLLLFHAALLFERIEPIQCGLEEEENKNISLSLSLFKDTNLSDLLSMVSKGKRTVE